MVVTHDPKAAAFGSRTIHLEKGELMNSGKENNTYDYRVVHHQERIAQQTFGPPFFCSAF